MGTDVARGADLLATLHEEGALSERAAQALVRSRTASREVGAALGTPASRSELLLATILVDDSPSIDRKVGHVRRGHAMMLNTLRGQTTNSEVQVMTKAFNRGLLSPYREIREATSLTPNVYDRDKLLQYTPLYKQSLITLGTVMAKSHHEEVSGRDVRTMSLIITDGRDNPDRHDQELGITASEVRVLIRDMLTFSTNHIVIGMGIGEGDWYRVFTSMGIPDDWIFDAGARAEELEAVFRQISRRLAIAASGTTGFAQLTAGTHPILRTNDS